MVYKAEQELRYFELLGMLDKAKAEIFRIISEHHVDYLIKKKLSIMKTVKINFLTKTLLLFGIVAIMALTMNSCTQKISFLTSSVVPAAEGQVTLKSDKNNNYVIRIEIKNLADVKRLQPPKNSYVVWMETDRGQARNVGGIVSSNNLNASFETVSAFKPIRIFITAEENENTQFPGPMVVLTTNKF